MRDIKFLKMRYIRGPNIWTYRSVLEAYVSIGQFEDAPSNSIPGMNEKLMQWLPGMIEHRCGIGERGGFFTRLLDGTWVPHILEHVTIELQNLAGIQVGFGKARTTRVHGIHKLVVRARDEAVARAAMLAAREVVLAAADGRTYELEKAIDDLKRLASKFTENPTNAIARELATGRGTPIIELRHSEVLLLGYGSRQRRLIDTPPYLIKHSHVEGGSESVGALSRAQPKGSVADPTATLCQSPNATNARATVLRAGLAEAFAREFENSNGRIRIASFCGSSTAFDASSLFHRIVASTDSSVGLFSTHVLGPITESTDTYDKLQADRERVLCNANSNAAVFYCSPESILLDGLPYDRCEVGVVTDVTHSTSLNEYYIFDEEQAYSVNRTQVDVVLGDGCAVLNADDDLALEMAGLCDGDIVLYTERSDAVRLFDTVAAEPKAVVFLKDNSIMIQECANRSTAVAVTPGYASCHQLGELSSTLLPAVAAAWAWGASIEVIRSVVGELLLSNRRP